MSRYVESRDSSNQAANSDDTYITPRTLLGIIRISQGLAKIRGNTVVSQEDVEESLRLLHSSRESLIK